MDEYILWLQNEKNYSAASQKQRISALSSFLKYASGREMNALSAYNAVSQAQTPKVPRTVFPYFSPEEIKILLSTPKTEANQAAGMLHYWLCFMIPVQELRKYVTS